MPKIKCSQCKSQYPAYYFVKDICQDCYYDNDVEDKSHFDTDIDYIRFLKRQGYNDTEVAKKLKISRHNLRDYT